MDQLTNLYKHKCEQLQEQLNNLTRMLNEVNSVLPTLGTPSLANELGYAPPVTPPSQAPPKPTKPSTPPPKPPVLPYPKPRLPSYPWPGAPTFPPKPPGMSDEDYQKFLINFQPYGFFPTPKPPREGDIGWGPEGSENYQKYLKAFEQWINNFVKAMQAWTTEYERTHSRPTDITSEAYARWFAEWNRALNEYNRTYAIPRPTYIPMPNDNK